MRGRVLLALVALVLIDGAGVARAEPAFAVQTGYRCSTCHVNQTGGGMRTAFGSLYTQLVLPQRRIAWRDGKNLLPANPDARFNVGADVRAAYQFVDTAEGENVSSFEITEANVYLQGRLIPGKLELYLDETVGPGGASTRELFGLFSYGRKLNAWVKVGRFLPSHGWRLPDDNSFIRNGTGFTYSAPDTGVELGFRPGRFTIATAVVNGEAGGGSDTNDEKKFVVSADRLFRNWRIGVSAANDIDEDADTTQGGLWAGANFGRLALLGEVDVVRTDTPDGRIDRDVAYFEANLLISRGLNVKYVHDWLDPDDSTDTDERSRDSLGVEWIPVPFVQLRAYVRVGDGPPQFPGTRNDQVDLELHLFF